AHTREISGPSRSAIVSALALVAALSIDPQASTAPVPPSEPAPDNTKVATPARPPSPTQAPRRTPRPPVVRWETELGLAAELLVGITPDPAWGGSLFLGVRRSSVRWPVVEFRGSLDAAAMPTSELGAGAARFQHVGGRVQACPIGLP